MTELPVFAGSFGHVIEALARASTAATVMAAIVWACGRLAPRLSPAVRCTLWWCVGLKLVVDLVWTAPVPVAILPAGPDDTPVASAARLAPTTGHDVVLANADASVASLETGIRQDAGAARPGPVSIALSLWLAGVLVTGGISVRRYRHTRSVIARSRPAPETAAASEAIAARLGLKRTPRVRVSPDVETPLVAGVFRPVVLLPVGFTKLPAAWQQMVLCHELAHVKRADLWLGCVPALAEALFFFHPLAHVAAHEYGLWREVACDDVVLRTVETSPQEYGQLLLGLGVSRPVAGFAAAGAPWSFSMLKRRITMLRDPSTMPKTSRLAAVIVVSVTALAMVPLQIVARAPSPTQATDDTVDTVPSEVAPLAVAFAGLADAGVSEPAQAQSAADDARRHPHHPDLNYVLFLEDGHRNTMTSGRSDDVARAEGLRRNGERLLWFRHDGKEYVVRDATVLKQVTDIWQPVSDLGDKQGEIGARQGELGAKQGQLGAKQGELGAQQGALGAQQGVLGSRQADLGSLQARRVSEADQSTIDRESKEIDRQMRELGKQMDDMGAKMKELGRPMRELGDQMDVLGNEMNELGKQMDEASAKAESAMRTLLERVVANGTAQPAPR